MSTSTPETVRSELGRGRMAIAIMVHTDSGWRFLHNIARPSKTLPVVARRAAQIRRLAQATGVVDPKASRANPRKNLVVRTAWALAGARLYMPVDDLRLASDLRTLTKDGREVRTIDVLCAESPA